YETIDTDQATGARDTGASTNLARIRMIVHHQDREGPRADVVSQALDRRGRMPADVVRHFGLVSRCSPQLTAGSMRKKSTAGASSAPVFAVTALGVLWT